MNWRENAAGRKLPLNPATGRAAASDNPETWGTRKAAERRAQKLNNGRPSGLGVMFAPLSQVDGWRLCGVDLDGCMDPDTGDLTPWADEVVKRFGSYAERSPSGGGAHVLFLCRDADFATLRDAGLVTDKGGAEFSIGGHTEIALFLGGRYFTVTEDQIGEEPVIRPVSRKTLEWLVQDHGPAFKRMKNIGKPSPKGGDESGSGIGFKYLCDLATAGFSEEKARDAIAEDDGDAGEWWHRAGERQQDRTVANAFARVERERVAIADEFDDLTEDDDGDAATADLLGMPLAEYREQLAKPTKTKTADPIAKMNRRHAVVALPNRVAVATFHADRVEFSGVRDLQALYKNRRLGKNTLADAWMQHKDRRTYRNGVVFDPTGRERPGILNLWTGWAVNPDPSADCDLILDHIRDVICAGNETHFRYVIGWLADLVQNPGEKPGVALVLKGRKGAGKDTLAVVMSKIIGPRHVAHIDQPERLTQKFNAHFATAILGHVEEAYWAGARDRKGILQALITSRTTTLERKGVDAITIDSFVRLLMTTNAEWAVPASADERRYAVFDVSEHRMQDASYFRPLYRQIDGDGVAGFLAHLLVVDLSDFDVRDVPQTGALLDQKIASLQNLERWWFEILWDGRLPEAWDFGEESTWADQPQDIDRAVLRADYDRWFQVQRFQGEHVGVREFGKRLKALCPEIADTRPFRKEGPRPKGYRIPPLSQCRELFNATLNGGGRGVAWDDEQSHESHDLL